MNLASNNKYLLLLLLLLIPGLGNAQNAPGFDELEQKFRNNYIFKADFTHEYHDTFTGEEQVTEGMIWVGMDQYKMQSGESIMLVDGEISQVYDGQKNRVIISDYVEEEDDFAPSRMLNGVDDSYAVEEHQGEENQTVIELTSEDPFSIFLRVSIFLDESGNPSRIVAIDQVENELITYFEQGEFIPKTDVVFQFTYPEDAEMIDLRHES